MPVFISEADQKVRLGRKQVEAKSLRHLASTCKVLEATGEAGQEFAKNVHRVRNTAKLRKETSLCVACWGTYDDPRGFAEGVEVPAEIKGKIEARISAKKDAKAAARKRGKGDTVKATKTGNTKAGKLAAKAKARRRKPARKPAQAKQPEPAATPSAPEPETTSAPDVQDEIAATVA